MATRLYTNNAATTLDDAITDSDLTIVVTSSADFPALSGGDTFRATLIDGTTLEIVEVTAVSGSEWTIVRAQEGTLASAFAIGEAVELRLTANSIEGVLIGDQSVSTTDSPVFVDATIDSVQITDLNRDVYRNMQTGIISGGIVSINGGDNTKFDITAMEGIVVDYFTDSDNPTVTRISYAGATAVTADFLLTDTSSVVYIDSAGVLQQTNAIVDQDFFRTNMVAGVLQHFGMTVITAAVQVTRISGGANTLTTDLNFALGLINISGNIYTANASANLTIDKSTGSVHGEAININNSFKNPNTISSASLTAPTILKLHQDGAGGTTFITGSANLDPDQYDDGSGTLQAVANNKWTIQRIFLGTRTNTALVAYGQNVYDTAEAAEAVLFTESFIPVTIDALLRAFLIIKKGTTDLTNTSNSTFVVAANISGAIGGAVSTAVAASTLQTAYDASTDPEIVLDQTKSNAGFSIVDDSTPITGNLLEVTDDPGTTGYFLVDTTLSTFDVNVDILDHYLDMTEISLPSNPAANIGRFYCRDVGSVTTPFFLDSAGTETSLIGGGGAGATTELDNLGTVAINTSLISDTDSTDDLGSTGIRWANIWVDMINSTNAITVGNGGTGAATFTDGGVLLGSGAGTLTATAVLANGELLIGDGATDPVLATITGGTEITVVNGAGSITINSDFTPSSAATLLNKAFDANDTGNVLSNVDVEDLADGTDGELITWDAAAAPTTVAAGTDGQVLSSNGAGAAPTFQDSDWELIGQSDSTIGGDSVADFAIPARFGTVVVVVKEIRASTDDVDLLVQMGTDASTFVSTNYSGEQSETRAATVTGASAATNGFMFSSAVAGNGIGTNAAEEGSGVMFITSMNESVRETRMTSAFFSLDATATENFVVGGGRQATNAQHTHLRLLLSSGTFEVGVISVYGIIGITGG